MCNQKELNDRVLIGVFATGFVYADRTIQEGGDYKQIAFLPFNTLELQFQSVVSGDVTNYIEAHARSIQLQRGEQYQISTAGQTITLGYALADEVVVVPPTSYVHSDDAGFGFESELHGCIAYLEHGAHQSDWCEVTSDQFEEPEGYRDYQLAVYEAGQGMSNPYHSVFNKIVGAAA